MVPKTRMGGIRFGLTAAVTLGALLLCASPAHAGRGFVLFTRGEDISKVADIPPQLLEPVRQSTGTANPAIGYKYGMFGVFFLNIWTWGGEYVVFDGDSYGDLGAEGAAQMLGVSVADLPKPFTYSFPPGLFIILVLGLGVLGFILLTKGSGGDEEDEE